MIEPPKPDDELQRVAELCQLQVLDTPSEERFDRITRTAQRLFGVPIALISLIDENRQWFKSKQGLNASQTPRSISFCGHAILREDAFIIPDTLQDERFHDNPLVTGAPHIRFYAGMPLHGPSGYRLGTLCLIDQAPRVFDEAQIAALADLAAWAELELDVLTVRQATALAREKETRLQAIVESAGDAIITIDEKSRIKTFNPAAARIFGHGTQSLAGQHAGKLVEKTYRARIGVYMRELLAHGMQPHTPSRIEVMGQRADGTAFEAEMVVSQIQVEGRREFIGIVRDISESKKIERMKNEFVSTVSHELRTPLTSIRGSLGLLIGGAAGEIPAPARQLLGIAHNNCERLVRLINDILDVEKIESGHIRFNMGIHSLMALVRQAIEATQSFALQFQVQFRLQPPDAGDVLCVLADPDRLVQVIVNLLSNAAKFSPAGGTVEVIVKPQGASVRLSVIDHGCGIAQEFRSRIFEKFAQADASDSRQKTGTGLGLSITRAIVEKLGGRIGFESEPGSGSEFFVDLPLAAPACPVSRPAASVLICEDEPDIANLLARMLEKGGLGSDVAITAEQARQMLMTCEYRAMTLDLALPGEDGLSLLRWLRAQEKTQNLPVVIVSARAQHAGDQAEGIEGGIMPVLDWITKPIDETKLLAAIGATMAPSQAGKPCVLYVEDDADLASVVGTLLGPAWEVIHAADLAAARSQLAQRRFNVILLDLHLPDGSGSELLCDLPALNALTPVVIFSGEEGSRHVSEKVQGALVKSRTSNQQLLDTLHAFVEQPQTPADRKEPA